MTAGERVREVNGGPVDAAGAYVLYWMIAARRLDWNQGLERAVGWARELKLPLLVFEPLRLDYPWASDRLHRFCLDGMADHQVRLEGSRVGYFPWVETARGEGEGLLVALAADAAVAVTDDFPSLFLPRMVEAAGASLSVRLEAVDSNGVLPLARPGRSFTTAFSFRRYLQEVLPDLLEEGPAEHPLTGDPLAPFRDLPAHVTARWAPASPTLLEGGSAELEALEIDHEVPPVPFRGGPEAAADRLRSFLAAGLEGYAEGRNHPDRERTSGLSPYLHWGHISSREVVEAVLDREGWTPDGLATEAKGRREGWWGLSADAEAFLDQLVTWRELGFVTAWRDPDHDRWESLPAWARETLEDHMSDPRPHLYDREAFETADTHDELWNAAQRELRERGAIHNYLRMLWGKKILEWSPTPREALDLMIELNDRWAVDGRDPNSTSGIFWVLGRYDRGWPERPVFGKVRSMTSRSTRRKLELARYLERFGP
jgi:deoxyribodipyrimidine photo-lyase